MEALLFCFMRIETHKRGHAAREKGQNASDASGERRAAQRGDGGDEGKVMK